MAHSFYQRMLALEDTPERIALAFAIGVFLSFSPLLGLHTFLGLTVAFVFGLNRVAVLIGLFVNNPWTLIPIYAAGAYMGRLLVGPTAGPALPHFGWHQILNRDFWLQLAGQWPSLKPLFIGSIVLSCAFSLCSYLLTLFLLQRARSYRPVREKPLESPESC